MKKIPIHLLINDIGSQESYKGELKKKIDNKVIDYIWIPVSCRNDLEKANKISSFMGLTPVWYLKNPELLEEIINYGNQTIALPVSLLKDRAFLLRSMDLLKKYKPEVYIYDDEHPELESDKLKFLSLVKNISEGLKKSEVNDIHLIVKHSNVSEQIEIYRKVQQEVDSSFTAVFESSDKRDDVALKNSLLLGNLFYFKVSDSILVEYEDIESCINFVNEDINLLKTVLNSLGIVKVGYTIISCPKCGRCQMDLLKINREVDEYLNKLETDYNKRGINLEDIGGITVAVMGCNVNGPGEARGADIGIAGGKNGKGTIFKYGTPFETLPEDRVVDRFIYHIKNLINKKIEESGLKVS